MPVNRFMELGALVVLAITGCGGGMQTSSPPPSAGEDPTPLPPPTAEAVHGRYVGTVTIAGAEYFADALFTADGLARIYFGGLGDGSDGVIPDSMPDTAAQFVGSLELTGDLAAGSGRIIGEGCAVLTNSRFCDETATGEIQLEDVVAGYSAELHGSIHVATSTGSEMWQLDLTPWNNVYPFSVGPSAMAGQYREAIAEFAAGGDTIMNVDQAGRLFFQSPSSGCTGNGSFTPHLDGAFNVLDVEVTIANCGATFSYLNGEFEGLATLSTSDYWAYDSVPRIWISKQDGMMSPAAVTMWWSLPQ